MAELDGTPCIHGSPWNFQLSNFAKKSIYFLRSLGKSRIAARTDSVNTFTAMVADFVRFHIVMQR